MTAAKNATGLKLPELPDMDFDIDVLEERDKRLKVSELMNVLRKWEDAERQCERHQAECARKGEFDQAEEMRVQRSDISDVQFTIKERVAELKRIQRCMDIARECRTKKLQAGDAAKAILQHLDTRAKMTVRQVLQTSQTEDHNEAISSMVGLWRFPEFREGLEAVLGITPAGRRA